MFVLHEAGYWKYSNSVILIRQRKHSSGLQGTSASENTSDWNVIYLNGRCIFRKQTSQTLKQRDDQHWRGKAASFILFWQGGILQRLNTSRALNEGLTTSNMEMNTTVFAVKCQIFPPPVVFKVSRTRTLLMLLCSFLHRLRRWWSARVAPRWQSILKRQREHDDETQAGKPTARSVKTC